MIKRQSFAFTVSGTRHTGAISVAVSYHLNRYDLALVKATKRVMALTGDLTPVFDRATNIVSKKR